MFPVRLLIYFLYIKHMIYMSIQFFYLNNPDYNEFWGGRNCSFLIQTKKDKHLSSVDGFFKSSIKLPE